MKKILLIIVLLFISYGNSFATNACDTFKPESITFVAEVKFGSNIRNYPCKNKSTVIGGVKAGETYNIIAKVDSYYKIELDNGSTGWVWDQSLKKSDKILTKKYIISSSDKKIAGKVIGKIKKLVNSKGIKYKEVLIYKLEKTLRKLKEGTKKYVIINEIIVGTKKISLEPTYTRHYKKYKIDMNKVKSTWKDWHNTARRDLGVSLYTYDSRLDNSAYEWSYISDQKGVMEHKRNYFDVYYDYKVIEKWFNDRGVICKVKNRATSSESIGKYGYKCTDNDCTDELINSLKEIFDIYMAEKGLSYPANAHYKAITHADISKIGLGLAISDAPVDENGWGGKNYYNYYVTTHYCTEFID
ncbi:SH3 domain-containing protein [Candidatus Gracilibacteria bacterium 28_42_T64]|nr:SH3 domain-containing protein [Candidatus Gracilibacteria bacterium 28_42_T64]